jgi:hypothetical protein
MDIRFKDCVSAAAGQRITRSGQIVLAESIGLEAIRIMVVASHVWLFYGHDSVTVTSLTEGKHSDGSKHYKGAAVDLRTREDNSAEQWHERHKATLAGELLKRLGKDFDVVVHKTHIHVEHDPK